MIQGFDSEPSLRPSLAAFGAFGSRLALSDGADRERRVPPFLRCRCTPYPRPQRTSAVRRPLQQGELQCQTYMSNQSPKGGKKMSPSRTAYVLEFAQSARVTDTDYSTQSAAVEAAKQLGHRP